MASDAHVLVVDGAVGLIEYAEARLRDLEARWSRFVPSSDVARLNTAGGRPIPVHADTITLVETMQHADLATHGRYDPTMLSEILDAGYVRSIDDARRVSVLVDLPSIGHTVHDLEIDRVRRTVRCPPGLGLDPGGIGKGLAGDLVVTELIERGAAGALVGVGGDLAFAGRPPRDGDWEIALGDPFDPDGEIARIGVSGGGVATSSTRSRRWRHRGRVRHHILDPRTRGASTTDLAAVTVVGRAGWHAEALATAALLETLDTVAGFLDAQGIAGLAVGPQGEIVRSRTLSVGALTGAAPEGHR